MSESADYYAVLKVPATATPAQIKQAYRVRAKQSHPDAGGSGAAMQQVNEAYRVLSNPALRREHDLRRTSPAIRVTTRSQHAPTPTHHSEVHHPPPHTSTEDQAKAEAAHHKRRLAAARASGWEIIKANAIAALLLGLIARFFILQPTNPQVKLPLALVSFIPVYGLALGLVFFISPGIRLNVHDFFDDLFHRRNPRQYLSKFEISTLIALACSAVPLAAIWLGILWGVIKP